MAADLHCHTKLSDGSVGIEDLLALHGGGYHFKGFARADTVGQQRIFAIEDMGHGVLLVGPQGNFRVHACKADMGTVIFTGAGCVEDRIVLPAQDLPALRVLENPLLELLADRLLLLLGDHAVPRPIWEATTV